MQSDPDSNLLRKLQQTIDNWNAEVTGAQHDLTRQIDAAKSQLHTLIDVISSDGEGDGAPQSGVEVATLQRALDEARGKIGDLEGRNQELDKELGHYKYQERVSSSAIELSRRQGEENEEQTREALAELELMRGTLEQRDAQLKLAQDEIESLATLLDQLKDERKISLPSSPAEAIEQLADLKTIEAELDYRAAEVETMRVTIGEKEATVQSQNQEILEKREEIQRLTDELAEISLQSAEMSESEAELRAGHQAMQQEMEAVKIGEKDLREELSTLTQQYERQAETLQQSVKELESHWKLAEEAERKYKELELQSDENAARLREQAAMANAMQEELRIVEGRAEQQQTQHELALENLRVEKQEEAYELLKKIEERGISKEDAETARELNESRHRMEILEVENEKLIDQMTDAQARLVELSVKPDSEAFVAASAEDGVLDEARADLETFEAFLLDREEAMNLASQKMQLLEETARTLHLEMNSLREEHQAALEAMAEAEAADDRADEIAALATSVEALQTEAVEHVQKMGSQAQLLEESQKHINALRSERDQAMAQASEAPKLLDEARQEVEGLRTALQEREAMIKAVSERAAATDSGETTMEPAFQAHDDKGHRRSMGEILVEADIITRKQLDSALEEQRTAKKRRIGSILVEKGFVREEMVAQVVASQLDQPFVRLADENIEFAAVAMMDGRLATHHMCFPLRATSEQITVAMANPLDLIAIEDLEFATSLKVRPVVATLSDITSAIVQHYGVTIANALEDNFENQSPPQALPKSEPAREPQEPAS